MYQLYSKLLTKIDKNILESINDLNKIKRYSSGTRTLEEVKKYFKETKNEYIKNLFLSNNIHFTNYIVEFNQDINNKPYKISYNLELKAISIRVECDELFINVEDPNIKGSIHLSIYNEDCYVDIDLIGKQMISHIQNSVSYLTEFEFLYNNLNDNVSDLEELYNLRFDSKIDNKLLYLCKELLKFDLEIGWKKV